MINADKYYKENLQKILDEGCWDENPRTVWEDGTPAYSKFITQVFETYDISKGEFPITTLRNTAVLTGLKEIYWIYILGSNKLSDAHSLGVKWWDNWDIGDGTIGKRYGATVKEFNLLNRLIQGIKTNPFGRRHIMNLYQYSNLTETPGLFPCAYETLWSVRKQGDNYLLDMTLTQRANDFITAGPINKIQYVGLQLYVAQLVGMKPGKFSHFVQNLHIYDRHLEAAKLLLERSPVDCQPELILRDSQSFKFEVKGVEGIEKLPMKLDLAI